MGIEKIKFSSNAVAEAFKNASDQVLFSASAYIRSSRVVLLEDESGAVTRARDEMVYRAEVLLEDLSKDKRSEETPGFIAHALTMHLMTDPDFAGDFVRARRAVMGVGIKGEDSPVLFTTVLMDAATKRQIERLSDEEIFASINVWRQRPNNGAQNVPVPTLGF